MPAESYLPRVSVLMPVHNGERYLLAAIQSVFKQTFKDFELLVVDDGSTDSTPQILEQVRDPRLRVVRNARQIRLIGSLNRGIQEARGDWIARMDADDLCFPERLSAQMNYLGSNPEVGVLGSDAIKIDEKNRALGRIRKPTVRIDAWAWIPTPLIHPTVVFRKSIALRYPYAPEALHCEDYDLWIRLARDGVQMRNLPRPLLRYRVHSQNITAQNREGQLRTCFDVFRRHYPAIGVGFDEYLGVVSSLRPLKFSRRVEIVRAIVGRAPWRMHVFEGWLALKSALRR